MANYIEKNTVEILKCSNSAMRALHYNLKEVINQENFDDYKQSLLNDFLERLDQNIYGVGSVVVDIMDFFGKKEEQLPLPLLVVLLEKTIEKIKKENITDTSFINLLIEFKNKILK